MPSCIINNDTNCPVCGFEPAPKVLLAPNVTFATGLVDTSQDIVDASVSVASGKKAALVKEEYPPSLKFTNSLPSNCFMIISFASSVFFVSFASFAFFGFFCLFSHFRLLAFQPV